MSYTKVVVLVAEMAEAAAKLAAMMANEAAGVARTAAMEAKEEVGADGVDSLGEAAITAHFAKVAAGAAAEVASAAVRYFNMNAGFKIEADE